MSRAGVARSASPCILATIRRPHFVRRRTVLRPYRRGMTEIIDRADVERRSSRDPRFLVPEADAAASTPFDRFRALASRFANGPAHDAAPTRASMRCSHASIPPSSPRLAAARTRDALRRDGARRRSTVHRAAGTGRRPRRGSASPTRRACPPLVAAGDRALRERHGDDAAAEDAAIERLLAAAPPAADDEAPRAPVQLLVQAHAATAPRRRRDGGSRHPSIQLPRPATPPPTLRDGRPFRHAAHGARRRPPSARLDARGSPVRLTRRVEPRRWPSAPARAVARAAPRARDRRSDRRRRRPAACPARPPAVAIACASTEETSRMLTPAEFRALHRPGDADRAPERLGPRVGALAARSRARGARHDEPRRRVRRRAARRRRRTADETFDARDPRITGAGSP